MRVAACAMGLQDLRVRKYYFTINAIAEVAELLIDSSFAIDINVHGGPLERLYKQQHSRARSNQ